MAHSEEEFAALHPGPVTVRVQCPADDQGEAAAWNLTGQVVPVTLSAGVRATVKELKDALGAALGGAMPANKAQLRDGARGFLRDAATLAAYNLGGGAVVDLVPRKRGGR
ncbi:hypothetical protein JKP88DRAFT_172800 [Tribonema minus]|uniref:Ubiquitin-like domain-containing protein n=1 Tax=Tribonema minus TaxID=303371 RepID=A0A836C7M6_9STRA|nr:hypothetical protein JKP88DRAFT_172800 [Tribonema minus]